MTIFYKFFLFTVFVSFYLDLSGQGRAYNMIEGEWINSYTDVITTSFNKKGIFKQFNNGKELVSAANKKKKENYYRLSFKNDTLWLYLTYSNVIVNFSFERRYTEKWAIQLSPNQITYFSYKGGKGIENHVDEYQILLRRGSESVINKTGQHITYIVPKNYIGIVWVAFNQADGVKPEYDSTGSAVLRIPESGILSTSLHEDVFATAQKNYKIVYEFENEYYINYKTFDKSERFDSTCCRVNERIALVGGFNQEGRGELEKYFGKKLYGNVFSFFIGTYARIDKNRNFPWTVKE